MAASRARTTKSSSPAESEPREDDGVPSFTTSSTEVAYDGPVLMRIDGAEYRMRTDQSFGASLQYLRQLRGGANLRDAQFALLDHVAGRTATDVLLAVPGLDSVRWNAVVGRAVDHVLGKPLEDEEGN